MNWTKPIHYDLGEPPEPLEYPAPAAFLDVDAYTMKVESPREVEDVLFRGLDVIASTAKSFTKHLLEEKP